MRFERWEPTVENDRDDIGKKRLNGLFAGNGGKNHNGRYQDDDRTLPDSPFSSSSPETESVSLTKSWDTHHGAMDLTSISERGDRSSSIETQSKKDIAYEREPLNLTFKFNAIAGHTPVPSNTRSSQQAGSELLDDYISPASMTSNSTRGGHRQQTMQSRKQEDAANTPSIPTVDDSNRTSAIANRCVANRCVVTVTSLHNPTSSKSVRAAKKGKRSERATEACRSEGALSQPADFFSVASSYQSGESSWQSMPSTSGHSQCSSECRTEVKHGSGWIPWAFRTLRQGDSVLCTVLSDVCGAVDGIDEVVKTGPGKKTQTTVQLATKTASVSNRADDTWSIDFVKLGNDSDTSAHCFIVNSSFDTPDNMNKRDTNLGMSLEQLKSKQATKAQGHKGVGSGIAEVLPGSNKIVDTESVKNCAKSPSSYMSFGDQTLTKTNNRVNEICNRNNFLLETSAEDSDNSAMMHILSVISDEEGPHQMSKRCSPAPSGGSYDRAFTTDAANIESPDQLVIESTVAAKYGRILSLSRGRGGN